MLQLERQAVTERFEYFIDDMIFNNTYTKFAFSDDLECARKLGLRTSYQNIVLLGN